MFKITRIVMLLGVLIAIGLSPALGQDLEADMQTVLYDTKAFLEKLQRKLISGDAISEADNTRLAVFTEQISVNHLLLQERFNQRQDEVLSFGIKAPDRHRKMLRNYLETIEALLNTLAVIEGSEDITMSILDDLKSLMDKALPKKKRHIYGSLPYRSLNSPAVSSQVEPLVTPAYMGGNMDVAEEDLLTVPEAPISESIATLAESLNWNPIEIYDYVKNNIQTQWYWGCMKGAEETLLQKSGNDADQAALLVALLRASSYPTRYVHGVIEFFPDLEKVKNLLGIENAQEIAAFFQKTGIPFEPVISGGKIANFHVGHIWVETRIPYSNYRGAVIDDHGKRWIAMDSSIKAAGFSENIPLNVLNDIPLDTFQSDYLQTVRPETPLSYLAETVNQYLNIDQPGSTYSNTLKIRTQDPEYLGSVPASLQFKTIAVIAEYTVLPDDLMHTVGFTARDDDNILFKALFPAYQLSNKQIVLTYEPETVEDQEIINSYGGLDNTPCYLVRLRPVLEIDGERKSIGSDGLSMGSDYSFIIDVIAPNGTHQQVINTHIIGNLSIVGLVCQDAVMPGTIPGDEKDAARLLFEEALNYIDRWNRSEAELAEFLQISITRPIPTMVTLGGVIDVSFLLDTPHGFDWKGIYVDADLRVVETAGGYLFADSQIDAGRVFKNIASLQGSVLESRVIEDDLGVESISAAKLMQLVNDLGMTIHTIDSTNIESLLSSLPFADNIKDDIADAVNSDYEVLIPANEIQFEDWTGIGYIKQHPESGDAGWMLSGMIAGGMTILSPDNPEWGDAIALFFQYSWPPNLDPSAAVKIDKISATNLQNAIVGQLLQVPLRAYVRDEKLRPVKGASVTFVVKSGGGILLSPEGDREESITVQTGINGVAEIFFTVGKRTSDNPAFINRSDGNNDYVAQVGLNIVDAYLDNGIRLKTPFTEYGWPDKPAVMNRETEYKTTGKLILCFAGFKAVVIEDEHGNPVSNVDVTFAAMDPAPSPETEDCFNREDPRKDAKLIEPDADCLKSVLTYDDCGTTEEISLLTDHTGVAAAYVVLGSVPDADYEIKAILAQEDINLEQSFIYQTKQVSRCWEDHLPFLDLDYGYSFYSNSKGQNIIAGKPGSIIPLSAYMRMIKEIASEDLVKTTSFECGDKECYKIVGTNEYEISTDFVPEPSVVKFNGNPAIPIQEGHYTYDWELQPGVNNVSIDLTGVVRQWVSYPYLSCDDCGIREEDISYDGTLSFEIYGVEGDFLDAQDSSIFQQVIWIDKDGFVLTDALLRYQVTPLEYEPTNCYVVIYKNDQPTNFIKAEFTEEGTRRVGDISISRGFKFDPEANYSIRLLLNNGGGDYLEIESGPVQLILLEVDIDVDSNNDLEITDEDDPIEDSESFVFWLNRDRDLEADWELDWPWQNIDTDNEEIDGEADLSDMAMLSITLSNDILLVNANVYFQFEASSGSPSIRLFEKEGDANNYVKDISVASGLSDDPSWALLDGSTIIDVTKREIDVTGFTNNQPKEFIFEGISAGEGKLSIIVEVDSTEVCRDEVNIRLVDIYKTNPTLFSVANFRPGHNGWEFNNTDSSKPSYTFFVHGYSVPEDRAKDSWFPSIYKRLYWSGHTGNFVGLTWEGNETDINPVVEYNENVFNALNSADNISTFFNNIHTLTGKRIDVLAHSLGNMVMSQTSKLLSPGDINNYVLCQAAVPANAYDNTVPRWEYLWDGDPNNVNDGFPLNADGTLSLNEVGDTVNVNDDLWVTYMEAVLPNVTLVNTFSMADGIIGGLIWGNNEKLKPTAVDITDRDSALPWSLEWAALAYQFPGRSRCAGHLPINNIGHNHNVEGEGINSHSALRERPIQDVWDFFSNLVDRDYVVGTSQR